MAIYTTFGISSAINKAWDLFGSSKGIGSSAASRSAVAVGTGRLPSCGSAGEEHSSQGFLDPSLRIVSVAFVADGIAAVAFKPLLIGIVVVAAALRSFALGTVTAAVGAVGPFVADTESVVAIAVV